MTRSWIVAAAVACLAGGCSTTRHVNRPPSAEGFAIAAQAQPSVLILYEPPPGAPESGSIVAADLKAVVPAGLVVDGPRQPVLLKLSDVKGYQVQQHGLGALEGTGIGLVAGATFFGLSGYLAGDDPPCTTCFLDIRETAKEKAVVGAVLGGLAGSLLGAIMGGIVGHGDRYLF
jgi:hypothetical protein